MYDRMARVLRVSISSRRALQEAMEKAVDLHLANDEVASAVRAVLGLLRGLMLKEFHDDDHPAFFW